MTTREADDNEVGEIAGDPDTPHRVKIVSQQRAPG
jgi:hypothetical protein